MRYPGGGSGGVTNSAGANVVTKSDGTNLVASLITDNGTDITISPAAAGSVVFQQAGTPTDHILKVLSSGAAQLCAITKDGYLEGTTSAQVFYNVNGAGSRWAYDGNNRIDIGGGSTTFTNASGGSGRFTDSAVAGTTRLQVYDVDNATIETVSVGAADSGGAGFKVLRIPN